MPPLSIPRTSIRRLSAALLSSVLAWVMAETAVAQPAPQGLDPNWLLSQYAHRAWQVEDGLPQNAVGAITQTRDGYLWLGTQQGLARFDGATFEVFDRTNTPALQNDWIKALLEDRSGALWIGTGGGLVRLHEGAWMRYTTEEGLAGDVVRALYEDQEGHLWIGTVDGGLSRFDGTAFTTYTAQSGLPSNRVTALEGDPAGALWVATAGGLARLQDGEVVAHHTSASGLPSNDLWALEASADGGLWIGTDEGIAHLREGAFTAYSDSSCDASVTTLHEDRNGSLWIGTLEDGLCRLHAGTFAVFTEKDGLTHPMIHALYEDREGILWIGTESGGLNRLSGSKFTAYTTSEGLSANVVYSIFEDRAGALWFGTEGGGLNRLHGDEVTAFTTADGLSSDIVLALHEDDQGRLWVGTFDGGLCRYDGTGFTCFNAEDGLGSDFVSAVLEDRRGTLWAATDGGLSRYEPGPGEAKGAFTTLTTEDGLPSNRIMTLLEDRRGDLWIGTWSGGVSRLDREGRLTSYTEEHGLSDVNVTSLYEDRSDRLWVGTHAGGLCRFGGDRFTCISERDGLHHSDVLQILEDGEGYLWLGSRRGLSRIRLADVAAHIDIPPYIRGKISRLAPTLYNESDGLRSREMNGGTYPAAFRSRDGRLWFATMRGAAVTSQAHLRPNSVPPSVRLVEFAVDGEPLPLVGDELRVPPGHKHFAVRFTASSLAAPEQVRFRYMLEGYDDDWTEVQNERHEHYTNLPPGTYRFRVTAGNNDGVWAEEEEALAFYVAPFFYQTLWFRVLCAAWLIIMVAGVLRVRCRQLKAREQHLNWLVDEQTRELQAQTHELEALNANLHRQVQRQVDFALQERAWYEHELIEAKEKAEASAQLKATILDNISHEIRTPLTAILGYAQILSEEVGEDLCEFAEYISQNGERLQKTLDAILVLSQFESDKMPFCLKPVDLGQAVAGVARRFQSAAEAKGITLRQSRPPATVEAMLDPSALERVLDNVVSNAIKFTEHGEVTIEVEQAPHGVCITVRDTGIGIGDAFLPHLFEAFKQESGGLSRTHEGSGLGLTITRSLVERMGGTIKVESRQGEGTTFTVCFPEAMPERDEAASPIGNAEDRPLRCGRAREERGAEPGVSPRTARYECPSVPAHASTRHRLLPRTDRLLKGMGAAKASSGPGRRRQAE